MDWSHRRAKVRELATFWPPLGAFWEPFGRPYATLGIFLGSFGLLLGPLGTNLHDLGARRPLPGDTFHQKSSKIKQK